MKQRYRTRRERLEASIERALEVLDMIDGPEDDENEEDNDDSHDEPDLGAPESNNGNQSLWSAGGVIGS